MKRAAIVAVLLVVIVGVGLWMAGCSRKTQAPPTTGVTGPGPAPPPGPGGAPTAGAFTYVCPDHPDQKSPTPAKCPTCGKPMKADTTDPVEYVCPMHPDEVKSEPGECGKCGMLLEARPSKAAEPATGKEKAEPAAPPTEEKGTTPPGADKGDSGST
jgi:hypothetical protein